MLKALASYEPWTGRRVVDGRLVVIATLVCGLAFIAALGAVASSKMGIALAILATFSPIALYLFIVRPFIFPFGIFVLLLPFDNVMPMSSFGSLTKLLGALSAVAILIYGFRTRRFVWPSTAAIVWAGFLVWAAVGVFWALDPEVATSEYYTYLMVIGLYLSFSCVSVTKSELTTVLRAVVLGGVMAAAYGAYYYHLNPMSDFRGTGERLIIQVGTSFIDPNHFSNALALPISIAIMLALRAQLSLKKFAYFGCVVMILAAYFFASSRGAFLGLAAMFVYFFIRSPHRKQILLVAALAVACGFALDTSLWQRFALAAASGGAGRFSIWTVGIAAFKHHFLLGTGAGNFPLAYDSQYLSVFQSYGAAKWDRPAHNLILQSGVEFGLVGLLLVLTGWFLQLRALSIVPRNHAMYDLRIALEGVVIALFVGSLSVDMLWYKYLWEAFILVALARNAAMFDRQPTIRAGETHPVTNLQVRVADAAM